MGIELSDDDIQQGTIVPFTDEDIARQQRLADEYAQYELDMAKTQRRIAFQNNSDPLFFKWQAGEATEQEWKDARAQVIIDNPYPIEPIS